MNRKQKILMFLTVLASAVYAKEYSLEDCFRSAAASSSRLAILRDETDKCRVSEKAAAGTFTPEITASGTFRYASTAPEVDISQINPMLGTIEMGKKNSGDLALSLNEVIFSGMARVYVVKLAQKSVETALLNEEIQSDALCETVLQLAYSYKLSQLDIESVDAGITRLKLNQERIRSFYDQGLLPQYDLLDIRSKVQEQESRKLSLESARQNVLIQLASVTGLSDITSVTLSPEYMEICPEESLDDAAGRLSKNLSLLVLQQNQDSAALVKKRNAAGFLPVIAGSGTFHYANPGLDYTGNDWESYYTIGVSTSLDIWDKGEKLCRLKTDELSIQETRSARTDAFHSLQCELQQTMESLHTAGKQEVLSESLFEMKTGQYDLVESLWKQGQKSTLDVLTAGQELTAADISVKNCRIQYLSLYQRILLLLDEPFWKKEI